MGWLASLIRPSASSDVARLSDRDSWFVRAIGGGATKAGIPVSESSALSIAAVWRAVNLISGTMAQLPLDTYERTDPKRRREATEHPAFMMLKRRPNPWMSAHTLRRTMQAHALLWGNGYAEIVRDDLGRSRELRLLLPDRTQPETKAGAVVYRTTDDAGRPIELPAADVLHIQGMGFDGLRGYSPIALHREGLGLTRATEEFGASWFGNGSKGGGIVEFPGDMSKEARDKLIREYEEQAGGKHNALRGVPPGVKYTALAVPPEDAQFLETRGFQIAEIARMYGVPLALLDAQGGASVWGTGIEQLLIGFVRYTLGDWISASEQEFDRKLFVDDEQDRFFTKYNVNALLRGDAKSRALYLQILVLLGVMTREEARAYEDLEFLDGYDLDVPLEPKAQAAPMETETP